MRALSSWGVFALLNVAAVLGSSTTAPTPTTKRDANSSFVTVKDGEFQLNGKPFFHFATTAYWLPFLSDDDITTTLTAIQQTGIQVVRTWAFKDVTAIPPDNSTVYFQLLANGTQTINTGPNGLQRLDKVISEAEKLGLKIQLALTNNWSAVPNDTTSALSLPSGFLSNDYGGMDAYVRNFVGLNGTHDQFFSNQSLIDAFQTYLDVVIARYANSTTLMSWELANDPRCNSTLPSSPDCQSQNVTRWVSTIGQHVKSRDPNHLVASGAGGFMCVGCPKLFATPAPAAPSPSAAARRRRSAGLLTAAKVMAKRSELLKKWRSESSAQPDGKTIRGRWSAPATRRQSDSTQGTAFNGAQGVDSEDINAIPEVDISTFQLFPDQNTYMNVDAPNTPAVTQAIDSGSSWIKTNADAAAAAGKPSALTAFGLVSLNSSSHFVPFNQSSVTLADVLNNAVKVIGANDTEQTAAYSAWIQAALTSGVSGIGQYQWGQTFQSSTSPLITTSPLTSASNVSQLSPDDGYADFSNAQKAIFMQAAQQQTAANNG